MLAIPALRVRGPYLAMVTIAFSFVVEQGAAEWSQLTGGWNGLSGIPTPSLFGHVFAEQHIACLVVALTLAAVWLYSRLSRSPWGMAMRAVRDAEIASQSIGLDPMRIRSVAFAISAAFAGIAGGVFASMSDFISPESFPLLQSILFLLVVMIGGAETVLGPLVGATIIVLLPELLSSLAQYRLLFVGVLLLVVLRLAPQGLVGLAARWIDRSPLASTPNQDRVARAASLTAVQGQRLEASDLAIEFGGVKAVSDVSFTAEPGRITSIIGPNGAGKSTVLNLMCGFYVPDAGSVRLQGQDITGTSSHAVARSGIARTYQTTQLFGEMSVLDNVRVALRRGTLSFGTLLLPDTNAESIARAEQLLDFVGYAGPHHIKAAALPHVDKRLVEIARALAIGPSVLALDEPAAGLDRGDKEKLGRLMRAIAASGIAVILVEHDMRLVMSVSDHVVVLDAGRKIAEGPPAAVARDERVLEAYLGRRGSGGNRRPASTGIGEKLLEVREVSAGYGAISVIRGVSLDVSDGELVAVLGANGAGKSTLMKALSGLNRATTGDILFLGQAIGRFSADRVVGRGLVLVPEGRQIFPELDVLDNLRLGAFSKPGEDIAPKIERMVARFPRLGERRHHLAGLLSGGEQQMLAIARGLMASPRVLMLDEPSLGLAPLLVEQLYELLAELRAEGTTILLVDQMAALALSIADRAYVLDSGTVTRSGSAAELAADPALVEAYVGATEAIE